MQSTKTDLNLKKVSTADEPGAGYLYAIRKKMSTKPDIRFYLVNGDGDIWAFTKKKAEMYIKTLNLLGDNAFVYEIVEIPPYEHYIPAPDNLITASFYYETSKRLGLWKTADKA